MTTALKPSGRAPAAFSSGGKADGQAEAPRSLVLKRALIAAATAFVTINIWTGCPLFALWVGSQISDSHILSMAAVGVVVVVLAILLLVMVVALAWLNKVYDELIGRPHAERRDTWLRSMRAEPEGHVSQRVGITTPERIIMVNVYVAMIGLAIWWVFFAGPPIVYA